MAKKRFHISDVLSVSNHRILSKDGVHGVCKITAHILGVKGISVITLGDTSVAATEFIEKELPWVKDVQFPEVPKGLTAEERDRFTDRFIEEAAAKYGEYHEVGQMEKPPQDIGLGADVEYVKRHMRGGETGQSR